jgi:SAM-dependent methyltransferase
MSVWAAGMLGLRGRMPARYDPDLLPLGYEGRVWRYPFDRRFAAVAKDGMEILDIGGGRWPTLTPDERPPGTTYVGLDVSLAELEQAPAGSYDELVVADVGEPPRPLLGRFDAAVSWLMFEHLRDVNLALRSVRTCLRPGGTALIFMAGRNSLPSRVNRLMPHRFSVWLLGRLNGRRAESVFEAFYDRCSWSSLQELGGGWSSFEVLPFYCAGNYFRFSRVLLAGWLAYEEWLMRTERVDQASFYLLRARR